MDDYVYCKTHESKVPQNLHAVPDLCEVWHSLPPGLKFVQTEASGGDLALCADQGGSYVWVPPDTVEAIKSGVKFLYAIGKRKGDRINIFHVDVLPKIARRDVHKWVDDFNSEQIARALKRQREED